MMPVRSLESVRLWVQVGEQGKANYAPVREKLVGDSSGKYFEGTMHELKAKGYMIHL